MIEEVAAKCVVGGDAAGQQVAVPAIMNATEQVETQAVRRAQRELAPSSLCVDGQHVSRTDDGEPLAQSAQSEVCKILSGERGAGKFETIRGSHQPVERENLRGQGSARDVGCAVVEARSEFDPAARLRGVRDFDTSLGAGAVSFERRGERSGDVGQKFASLNDAGLSPQRPLISQLEALLEACLWLPEPQIARAGQRRDPHLSQRIRTARRENGFVLPHHQRA